MRLLGTLLAALVASGCDSSEEDPNACSVTLAPSDDDGEVLQTAFIERPAGSVICLEAGTYVLTSELSISTDDVTLRGAGRDQTVLDFTGQDFGAQAMHLTGDRITIEAIQIKNAGGDGLRTSDVDGVTMRDLSVVWTMEESTENGPYGLYPIQSRDVLIDGCYVRGASDAGIYVGQSERVVVRNSEAEGNVAGIEVENCTDAEVYDNHAHDNTAGILVFNLPELPVQDGKRAKVHSNLVENNNVPNFGKMGSIVGRVPGGSGVIVLAADDTEIHGNTIRGNGSTGVLLLSYQPGYLGEFEDDAFDIWGERTHIHDNTWDDNGGAPQGDLAALGLELPLPDIIWDGCSEGEGVELCIGESDARFQDIRFCNGLSNQSSDLEPFACSHAPLDPVDLL